MFYGKEKVIQVWNNMSMSKRHRNISLTSFILSLCHRLDLVPINRSVGLKAKPTKPVTEVLRPVVAKYGLNLGELVARIVSQTSAYCLKTRRSIVSYICTSPLRYIIMSNYIYILERCFLISFIHCNFYQNTAHNAAVLLKPCISLFNDFYYHD